MMTEVPVANWTAGDVARVLDAKLRGEASAPFAAATTDSRESRKGVAFFALDGARRRGMEFVSVAFGSGCSVVVVPNDFAGVVPDGRAAVLVEDPKAALLSLAQTFRAEWQWPRIGITGSTGKTTVKEMTAHALGGLGAVLRSPGNYNTTVGLATTILSERGPFAAAVLECGASEPGEIARLGELVRPTASAVTNVAPAHLLGFGSVKAIRREKCELLRAVPGDGLRLVDGDDPELVAVASECGPITRVGFGEANDFVAERVELDAAGRASFRVDGGVHVGLQVPGKHQAKNALFALSFATALGVPLAEAAGRLATFTGVSGRLAIREVEGRTIVDDSYNSNPSSTRVALQWLAARQAEGRKAVALGDMLELGDESAEHHAEIGRVVAELGLDFAVWVGPESRAAFEACAERLGDRALHVDEADEAAQALANWISPGDTVLVKGSRGMRMERVVRALTEEEEGA